MIFCTIIEAVFCNFFAVLIFQCRSSATSLLYHIFSTSFCTDFAAAAAIFLSAVQRLRYCNFFLNAVLQRLRRCYFFLSAVLQRLRRCNFFSTPFCMQRLRRCMFFLALFCSGFAAAIFFLAPFSSGFAAVIFFLSALLQRLRRCNFSQRRSNRPQRRYCYFPEICKKMHLVNLYEKKKFVFLLKKKCPLNCPFLKTRFFPLYIDKKLNQK